jgi:cell wall-associated NlpC family hydrolase
LERFIVAKHVGRHRAPGFSPLTELTQIAGDSAKPAVRATAVMAVSSGMLAGMVVPAHAAPIVAGVDGVSADGPAADGQTADQITIDILGISGVPSTDGPGLAPVAAVEAAAAVGPVVTAPDTVAGLPTFGALGFKTKTIAVPAATQVSRSTTARTSPAPTAAKAPAAPVVRAPVSGGSVISVAASLLGIPYRYGGSTPSGFDCSGFTSYVYRIARGISIPRTAEGQRKASARTSSPVPGDLVFFGIPATHVGIYAGNGMMYDSPHSGEVTQLRKIYSGNVTYGRF